MTEHIAPAAPESVPKYIADGIPKQDVETLDALREYVDAMIKHKRRPVSESEIPADAEVIEDGDDGDDGESKGTIYVRKNTCGDETCHCMTDGDLHGPYKYLVFRDDSGTVVTEYKGPA